MTRYHNLVGGFSLVPHDGWTMMQAPGDQYEVCRGPFTEGFQPTITFHDTTDFRAPPFAGSLQDYIALTRQRLEQNQGITQVEQTTFVTDSGLHGIKFTYEWPHTAGVIRVLAFFFEGKDGRKIVVYCSALAHAEKPYAAVFYAAMKTFALDP
jgi:hypothetical protein